mmetsp:Transcript_96275/g.249003  ORF Transcript_96275/g.249003 Transcript_96275/m.249003 type:complete len:274 (-) Transcript_96275:681-1502(-)
MALGPKLLRAVYNPHPVIGRSSIHTSHTTRASCPTVGGVAGEGSSHLGVRPAFDGRTRTLAAPMRGPLAHRASSGDLDRVIHDQVSLLRDVVLLLRRVRHRARQDVREVRGRDRVALRPRERRPPGGPLGPHVGQARHVRRGPAQPLAQPLAQPAGGDSHVREQANQAAIGFHDDVLVLGGQAPLRELLGHHAARLQEDPRRELRQVHPVPVSGVRQQLPEVRVVEQLNLAARGPDPMNEPTHLPLLAALERLRPDGQRHRVREDQEHEEEAG